MMSMEGSDETSVIQRIQSSFGNCSASIPKQSNRQMNIPPQMTQNLSVESNRRPGIPPASPHSQLTIPKVTSPQLAPQNLPMPSAHSRSLSQSSFFSFDHLPPLSPSPYRDPPSTMFGGDMPLEESRACNLQAPPVPPPPTHGGNDRLPPRRGHRRSSSDVPLGFTSIAQPSPQLKRESDSQTGFNGFERKSEGEVVEDLFSAYMNLDSIDTMNSSSMDDKDMDSRASGTKTNDSSENEVESSSNNSIRGKRSATGDIAPASRHFRSLSMDSFMGNLNFNDESPRLPPSPGQHSPSDSFDGNSSKFSLEFGNGEFSSVELKKIMASEKLAEIAMSDPKRAKSTLGQGLQTSTYPGEVIFSIALAIFGLILFALLIGNMQTYLQSITIRLEEMRIKRRDSEQWMHHRLLPQELRERVRSYDQYKWLETRGVDEDSLVRGLPKDLRRDIKRHLCLAFVRRVPLFDNMDERLLDAICERLKPSLYTENTFIVREGDPVDQMLFIVRGRLMSETTDGGRSGFLNRSTLLEGDFCGEELLTWALDPKSGSNLPSSTRTVKAVTEVEAFVLEAEELKFVAGQFRRLHSRQVQHTFRFYSQQWRTWAARFIQAAWRRHLKRKAATEQSRREEDQAEALSSVGSGSYSLGATLLASRFAANALRGVHRSRVSKGSPGLIIPVKPQEPDFSADDAN